MNLSSISKAIAGGIVAAIIAELARFGFHPGKQTVTTLNVVVTAAISYVAGHLVVYFAPKNQDPPPAEAPPVTEG